MSNIDFACVALSLIATGYCCYIFFYNSTSRLKNNMRELNDLQARMREQINAIREIYTEIRKDIICLRNEKDRIAARQKEIYDIHAQLIEVEEEYEQKKVKNDSDLANARSKSTKMEARAKQAEARLADLLTKIS